MILSFLYELALLLVFVAQLPKMLYMRLFYGKYKQSFPRKFGLGFPSIDKQGRYLIWIHAVSLGETKAVVALAKLLKAELDNPFILISSSSETGHAEAKKSMPFADAHVYLPFDFGWIVKPIVRKVKPDLVILCESDFWYNFIHTSKAQGAKVVLINGKVSERSFRRFSTIPWFTKSLFAPFDTLCIQSHHYEKRFEQLGLDPRKMTVTGNIKFDDPHTKLSPQELEEWKGRLGIEPTDRILVGGSTHDPEEKLLLDIFESLHTRFPNLKLLLVPRHPERFNEVAALLQQRTLAFQRYSQIGEQPNKKAKVILIDAMGQLRKCYQLAEVAVVGGSFTARVGGHSIIEPAWYGVPVLFGPHMHSQPELLELVQDYHSGKQVSSEQLPNILEDLLANRNQAQSLGNAGLKLVQDMQGATRKTWEAIKN